MIQFLTTYPAIAAGVFSLVGVIIGASISQVVAWRLQVATRRAEWSKRRKDAYARWIAIYTEKIFKYYQLYEIGVSILDVKMRCHNYQMAQLPGPIDQEPIGKMDLELDELRRKDKSLSEECSSLHLRLHEATAVVYMIESDAKVMKRFKALREKTPDFQVGSLQIQKKSLENFEAFVARKTQEMEDFAFSLADGL